MDPSHPNTKATNVSGSIWVWRSYKAIFILHKQPDVIGRVITPIRFQYTRALAAGKVGPNGIKPQPDQNEIDALAPYFAGMDAKMKKVGEDIITPVKYFSAQIAWPIVGALMLFLV